MKHALIFHGAGNNASGNWFPWLKNALVEKGYTVWLPDLPHADSPQAEEWVEFIFANKTFAFPDAVLLGHSAGATLILRLLEKLPASIQIAKAILVAAYVEKGTLPQFYPYKEGMLKTPFAWEKIRQSCKEFVFLHSDNDPYQCGKEQGEILHKHLGGRLVIEKGQGHFNLEVGEHYRQFPKLVTYI